MYCLIDIILICCQIYITSDKINLISQFKQDIIKKNKCNNKSNMYILVKTLRISIKWFLLGF
jgi:hypothetical protein